MKHIDWQKLWNDFDKWHERRNRINRCDACGTNTTRYIGWHEQRDHIVKLVNAQLRRSR